MRAQLQDFIAMYNNLTKTCFDACVTDFKAPNLQAKEVILLSLVLCY